MKYKNIHIFTVIFALIAISGFISCAQHVYHEFGTDIKRIEVMTRQNQEKLQEVEEKLNILPGTTHRMIDDIYTLSRTIQDLKENLQRISYEVAELNIVLKNIQDNTEAMHYLRAAEGPQSPGPTPDHGSDIRTRAPEQVPEARRRPSMIAETQDIEITDEQRTDIGPTEGHSPSPPVETKRDDTKKIEELKQLYQEAVGDLLTSIYSKAIQSYEKFIKEASGIDELKFMVVKSYYSLGEAYYYSNDHNNAITNFEMYIKRARETGLQTESIPDAYYLAMISYKNIGMIRDARRLRDTLRNEYQDHPRTKEAQELGL